MVILQSKARCTCLTRTSRHRWCDHEDSRPPSSPPLASRWSLPRHIKAHLRWSANSKLYTTSTSSAPLSLRNKDHQQSQPLPRQVTSNNSTHLHNACAQSHPGRFDYGHHGRRRAFRRKQRYAELRVCLTTTSTQRLMLTTVSQFCPC